LTTVEADIRLADGDHVVQFYGAEDELVGAVVGYLSGAVLDGDSVIVIATPDHRGAFEDALGTAGVDVEVARGDGRLLVLDADDTLAGFMVDGRPDPATFDAVVGTVVRGASADGRRVRAFGEMVALLWDAGNVPAAIELEELWNGLGQHTPFSLFCAYPAHLVSDWRAAEQFSAVCHLHSEVVAGAPVLEGCEVTRRFARSERAPRLARRFVVETLHGWGGAALVDDAAVVVAELTANAVMHAESDFTVGLARRGDVVRIAVGDSSPALPAPRALDSAAVGGRGLLLVDQIAHDWGHSVVGGGKLVWADLHGDVDRR
jgi:hypothetical protein